ncbi:BEN domain-containing protein 5, partial [Trachymyrmex cornetzi]
IHLGRNVWVPKASYNAAVNSARSGSMVVKNMALVVFGHEVLKNSSVTGIQCNSKKNKEKKPKLDATKLLAIKGIGIGI